jgi:hypothetical protein
MKSDSSLPNSKEPAADNYPVPDKLIHALSDIFVRPC